MTQLSYFLLIWGPRIGAVIGGIGVAAFLGFLALVVTGNVILSVFAGIGATVALAVFIDRSCDRERERRAKRAGVSRE